ncbi:glycosyltransferase family 4 protein [Aphanizomenon sp. PH219]|uniref:glycosyltransferase family 4 protein n=1 Tax=Aphanizomenon flos-aquae TaxID=1176 RepID=UPI0004BCA44A|nr:glycosyltransferase family 4 protein [Aphanizomenon flos-aquae]MDK2411133.1 glycosyltransferase family 4 protein [Aphanizomenon sp. 202]MDK2458807.1 glycosyltransferase family 4 protein [Aphanizomenon sp. PH219]
MLDRIKILIISHGHPAIIKGGGEIAAYNLFKELKKRDNCDVVFLAYKQGKPIYSSSVFETFKSDGSEILITGGYFDYYNFSQLNTRLHHWEFRSFLESFAPDVIHFHHYIHLGLEFIREVRKYSKNIPILMTLHEYLAICNNDGQMVKTSNNQLCYQYEPDNCHKCFPDKSAEDFKLRELYIKSFFRLVDLFVAPSNFLLERYVNWGISRTQIIYLDYGQPVSFPTPPRNLAIGKPRNHFAYFGQLNIYKGLLVLLEAIEKLTPEIRTTISLDIYGSNLELQPKSFQDSFWVLLDKTQDCVHYHGLYQSEELAKLIANIDWVIVPSIWWENAPLVIEEAFMHKRPIICSNIGGMAEKVEHEKSGLHFGVGDSTDLAKCITRAVTQEGLWENLSNGISPRLTIQEVADKTYQIYVDKLQDTIT